VVCHNYRVSLQWVSPKSCGLTVSPPMGIIWNYG
jgi:hypothetical protein